MSDMIGRIPVPAVVASGTTFPLKTEFGNGFSQSYPIIVHKFGQNDAKSEQRYQVGIGPKKHRFIRSNLNFANRNSLASFWENLEGSYKSFTYNAPNPDQTTTAKNVVWEQTPLSLDYLIHACRVGLNFVEIPDPASAPTYAVSSTCTRFPSGTLATALLSEVQQLIPLIHIKVRESAVSDIYLSDRRCTVGGQLYLPRVLGVGEPGSDVIVSQNIKGAADNVQFQFANSDQVMTNLSNDTDLKYAVIDLSFYHVNSGILIQIWKGFIQTFVVDGTNVFNVQASDGIFQINQQYPNRLASRSCYKTYNDGNRCPWASAGASGAAVTAAGGDPASCDFGWNTTNGCVVHGMSSFFGGIPVLPQSVRVKDNSTGFLGFDRNTVTATSLVSDTIWGRPLPDIWCNQGDSATNAFFANALIAAVRDNGDFFDVLGILGTGPLGGFTVGGGYGGEFVTNSDGYTYLVSPTADGYTSHGLIIGSTGTFLSRNNNLGLRQVIGNDPIPSSDYAEQFDLANIVGQVLPTSVGGSAPEYPFAAGVSFCELLYAKPSGITPSTTDQHSMTVPIAQGLSGYGWQSNIPAVSQIASNTLLTFDAIGNFAGIYNTFVEDPCTNFLQAAMVTIKGVTGLSVQKDSAEVTGGSPTLIIKAFPGANTLGNTILVDMGCEAGFPLLSATCTDTNGNTYIPVYFIHIAGIFFGGWVAFNCAAGANTVTVATSGFGDPLGSISIAIEEVPGGTSVDGVGTVGLIGPGNVNIEAPASTPGVLVHTAMYFNNTCAVTLGNLRSYRTGLINPFWIALNTLLKATGQFDYNDVDMESLFVMSSFQTGTGAGAAEIAEELVTPLVGSGTELQFQFQGTVADQKPLRDWLVEILNVGLGYFVFEFGKFKVGIRINATSVDSYSIGNIKFQSLHLDPVEASFESLIIDFADVEYQYQANIATYTDKTHAAYYGRAGAPLTSRMHSVGSCSLSQSLRLAATRTREEIGGVNATEWRNARKATWETTLLGVSNEPGQVIDITDPVKIPGIRGVCNVDGSGNVTLVSGDAFDPSMGGMKIAINGTQYTVGAMTGTPPTSFVCSPTVPTASGVNFKIINMCFRIDTWTLRKDYSVVMTGKTVTPSMYDLEQGPMTVEFGASPNAPLDYNLPDGLAWFPWQDQYASGDPLYPSEWTFDVSGSYNPSASGLPLTSINIAGVYPVNQYSPTAYAPVIKTVTQSTTGGTIPGGSLVRLSLCAIDSAGLPSTPASILLVAVPTGTNTNTITISNILWPAISGLQSYALFASLADDLVSVQLTGALTPGSPVTVYTPNTLALTSLVRGSWALPDTNVAQIQAKAKLELLGGVIQASATSVASNTIVSTGCIDTSGGGFTPVGRVLSIVGRASGSVPAFNTTITGYNHTTGALTCSPDPSAVVQAGDIFQIRVLGYDNSANTSQFTDAGFQNETNGYAGLTAHALKGAAARVISGKSRGLIVNVTDNTATTVDFGSALPLDTTSVLIFEDPTWNYSGDATAVANASPSAPVTLNIPTQNYLGQVMIISVFTVDVSGAVSPDVDQPIREYYAFGAQVTTQVATNYTVTPTDGTVQVDSTSGNQTTTLPNPNTMTNQVIIIQKTSADTNTVTINGTGLASPYILNQQNSYISFKSNGTTWTVVSGGGFSGPTPGGNIITTKGDIIAGNTAGVAVRLPVGSDGKVLTADSTSPDGLKWAGSAGSASSALKYTTSWVAQTSVTVSHNLGTTLVLVQAFDVTGNTVSPQSITITDSNTVTLGFGIAFTGSVVVIGYGTSPLAPFYSTSWVSQNSVVVTHNLSSTNVLVQVYDVLGKAVEPQKIAITSGNVVTLTFGILFTGSVVVVSLSSIKEYSTSFTAVANTPLNIAHYLETTAILVQVYDASGNQVSAQNIQVIDANNASLTFGAAFSGTVVIIG